jgi:hypothetical protein
MRAFLSHISEEALEATAIKEQIEKALPGTEVFVSAADIHLGDAWLRQIDQALGDATVVLTLCSPNSVRRPWLNFESGGGWARKLRVIPLCHKGMRKDDLPDPMGAFHGIELVTPDACLKLVLQLADHFHVSAPSDFSGAAMLTEMSVQRPQRTGDVGVVLCHRQHEWEDGPASPFSLATSLPAGLSGGWRFHAMDDDRQFLSPDLHKLSGLILGMPWRATMKPETITSLVEWVRAGGRLLLLGFELGDRHHNGNLGELAYHFGIYPAADIVSPPGFPAGKPYDETVTFDPAEADQHPFTQGLSAIRLSNIQTLRADPGGTEWLRVGSNDVLRPRRDGVRYRDGTMTAPAGAVFEALPQAAWLPVAAQAPPGLCGAGGVHMIGTWDVFGRRERFDGDNLALLRRLFDWLAGGR